MKKTTLLLLLLTAIATTSSKCKKDAAPPVDNPYGLPNATQTGANVFAYLRNGQVQIVPNSIYTLGGGIDNDTLGVAGSTGDNTYFERVTISIRGGIQESTFQVDNPAPGLRTIWISTNKNCIGVGNVQNIYSTEGKISLTKLDKTNKIISGTFYCKIPIPNCDTLNITEGRFDIKYY